MSSETTRSHRDRAVTATLDAGEENCATLILNVRDTMRGLSPGDVLNVVAYDPSAHLDLMAWARMTGHDFLGKVDHTGYASYYLRKGAERHG